MKKLTLFILLFTVSMTFSQSKMYIWKGGVLKDSMSITDSLKITFGTNWNIPTEGLVAWYQFNGDAKDASGNGNNGTTNGGCVWSNGRSANSGQSISFNGTDAFVSVQNSTSLQSLKSAFTFSFWINITDYLSNQYAPVFAKSNTASAGMYSLELFKPGTAASNLWIGSSLYNFNPQIVLSSWSHYCFTWDGSTVKYYLNGSLIDSKSLPSTIQVDALPLNIGRHTPGNIEYLNGKIDDFILYNRALSASEIQLLIQ